MNIYDCDGTLYSGDSTVDFLKYSFKKHPSLIEPEDFRSIKNAELIYRGDLKKYRDYIVKTRIEHNGTVPIIHGETA